jgi:hypothetical protein
MAKGDIQTAPGTGLVGKLTPDQKVLLKQMWAELLHIADGNTGALETVPTAAAAPAAAAKKGGWFGGKAAETTAVAVPATKVNVGEIGIDVKQLRTALWNNILGDHPGKFFFFALDGNSWEENNST